MATLPTVVHNASFSTASTSGGPRINIDYRTQLVKQRESAAPFLSLMLNINSQKTETHQFSGFETRPNPKKSALTADVAAGGSAGASITVPVTNGKYFAIGDIVKATGASTGGDTTKTITGRVTAVSGNNLTVYPNDPTLTIAGMSNGQTLQVWGSSYAQGALSATPTGVKPDQKTFYTQIFKHAYQVNRTQANNRLYGSPERDRLRGEKEIEHMIEIEKAMLNGDGTVDTTSDTDPRTNMTGLLNQFTSNIMSYGAELTEDELFDFMTTLHAPKYAPDGKMSKRMVLASADLIKFVNKIAIARSAPREMLTVYGVDVFKVVFANRTWEFVEDPVLSDFLPGWGVVFHPRYVKLREFRPTRLEANIQANDADYYKDQFLTELGLEVYLEELGGILRP